MKRIIIFLIRKKLKLKKHVYFQFTNQKSQTDRYYFTSTDLMKIENGMLVKAGVSLNWLLDDECEIRRLKK